jgi:hypothetical protein
VTPLPTHQKMPARVFSFFPVSSKWSTV